MEIRPFIRSRISCSEVVQNKNVASVMVGQWNAMIQDKRIISIYIPGIELLLTEDAD